MADKFVLVRLLKITGADLQLFDFDYDLTWVGFFLTPDEKVVGRFGGRDASGPDGRLSLAGLRYAMQSALAARKDVDQHAAPVRGKPVLAENYPAAKKFGKECIHCHQVYEFRRDLKTWKPADRWGYPLPENVGLTLEVDRGNAVKSVAKGSEAARIDLRPGDVIRHVNGVRAASQADFQYGLHRAPWKGEIEIVWERDGNAMQSKLKLADGWRKTNLTWRPSLLDVLPSLTLSGEDLSSAEKKKLGLDEKRLAFAQDAKVHSHAAAAGVKGGDVVLGLKGEAMEMTFAQFLAHVRKNYLVGDRIELEVLRDGKKLGLPMTLK